MILQKIVENRREEVARQKEILPLGELRQMLADRPPTRDFEGAIRNRDCAVIAEVKRSSPSKGRIREDFDPVGIAGIYEDNGASAISILTERKFFEGRAAYIPQIRRSVRLPLLRKDFIIDPYQINETRVLGADALLLIARLLEAGELRDFIGLASELGLAALVEVHDEADVEKAVSSGARIVGINNRDLATFRTDLDCEHPACPSNPERHHGGERKRDRQPRRYREADGRRHSCRSRRREPDAGAGYREETQGAAGEGIGYRPNRLKAKAKG